MEARPMSQWSDWVWCVEAVMQQLLRAILHSETNWRVRRVALSEENANGKVPTV